jgi:hypothetical protein
MSVERTSLLIFAVGCAAQRLNVDGGSDIQNFCSSSFVPSSAVREPLLQVRASNCFAATVVKFQLCVF